MGDLIENTLVNDDLEFAKLQTKVIYHFYLILYNLPRMMLMRHHKKKKNISLLIKPYKMKSKKFRHFNPRFSE